MGCCPQGKAAFSLLFCPVSLIPGGHEHSYGGGWGGNKTEKPRRKRAPWCQEIHSTVRGGIESASGGPGCRLESTTWHRRARLPSPSPASQALHGLVCSCRDRATCPQTPKQRHVHTVWGRGDGLQAEGQSTKSLLTPNSLPYGCTPAVSDVAACGHLAIPTSQALSAACSTWLLFMRVQWDTIQREKGYRRRCLPETHRAHPSHCATDTWGWGHVAASKSNPQTFRWRETHCCKMKGTYLRKRGLKVFTKLSTGFRPQCLPKLCTTGCMLCKTRRETLLYSIPCKWYEGKAIPRQGQGL